MSDRATSVLEEFLAGERTLAEVETELAAAIAADPRASAAVLARLDEFYRAGRLPVQVHHLLARVAAPGSRTHSDDATRPQPVGSGAEATRLAPLGSSGVSESAKTVPGAPSVRATPHDSTRPFDLGVEEPARDAWAPGRGPEAPAHETAHPTGSNWENPEQWRDRHDGVIGPGSIIKDRFLLESELGHGGMGVVYRAIDRRKQEAQDRDPYVAIKILNEEFRRHPSSLIALQRESRKAQQLAHPNIITVHDFDRDGTTVFMTMELLDGEPLNRVITSVKGKGFSREQALPLIHGLGEALSYAHKNGIVHSDFKPGNVFLTRRGDVKVLDFGIARAVPTQLRPDADRTVFDATELGALTPTYASAEMLEGAAPEPADDVFALAIVTFELLAGRHPFDKTPAHTARDRGLRLALPAGLSRRQRRALTRGLAFERGERHVDARAFLADFEGPGPVKKAAYATAAAALVVAAIAVWQSMQVRPDAPFERLSLDAQQNFNRAVTEGSRALGFGDVALNEAFDYFADAYRIHRNNPRAVQGLESVADRFLTSMRAADADAQENVLQKLYCQEYLSRYPPVLASCEDVLGTECSVTRLACPVDALGAK